MDSWFVTGAGGFLGSNAGAYLNGRATTYGLAHAVIPKPALFDHVVTGDITDIATLRAHLERIRPNVILHTAAVSGHEACERNPALARMVNEKATKELAAIAESIGSRFVFISTDAVFNGARGAYVEDDEREPFSVYGETKAMGEIASLGETSGLVVRTNFFGWSPTGQSSILEFFRSALSEHLQVNGYTDLIVSSMYVQHLLTALWNLNEQVATGIYHVAAHDSMSKYDFGCAVAQEFNLNSDLITPIPAEARGKVKFRDRNLSLNVSRFEALLGAKAPSHLEGLIAAHTAELEMRVRLAR
jgi:dTDP-4-dehydrorhamnose reductase